jgi:hypothetical protein
MVGALWDSLWVLPLEAFMLTAAVVLGRWLAWREEQHLGTPRQCRVGPFERSAGAMLAFLLGFTFALSAGNFREAQATLQREADAIAETYRWAQLLPEADRRWFQDALRAYADRLIGPGAAATRGPEAQTADREIRSEQTKLWEGLRARRAAATDHAPYDACLKGVNQFIQAYDQRYVLNRHRLPDVVVLFTLGGTLFIGFLVGYTSESQAKHFRIIATVFVVFLTTIVYLIWEIDHPRDGLIVTSRQNLVDLADRLRGSSP